MRSKFIKVAFVAAVALVSGINVFNAQQSEPLSDVALANVEALADGELLDKVMECGKHGCVIDFSWDCLYPTEFIIWGYCPNMRGQ